MAPTGVRLTREKRLALANCNGLLVRACDELEEALGRDASRALDSDDLDQMGPLAVRVIELRRHRRRLEAELRAIAGEWAVEPENG